MAGGADHQLLDTVRRRLRAPAGWVVVALRMSRLAPPAPRPHHRRIARVLMQDVARRHDGEVFVMGNGDLVLLCRAGAPPFAAPPGAALRVATPGALPDVLARLLRADAPDAAALTSLWPLESASDHVLRYALDSVAAGPAIAPGGGDQPSSMAVAAGLAAVLDGPDIADLLRRRTAVVIAPDGMRPLFREIRFSMAALAARTPAPARSDPDPFLLRHLAERMDRRMLSVLHQALGAGEALDAAAPGAPPLHINMTLSGLRSEEFATLARATLERRLRVGVELSVLEACAEPERFAAGREALGRLRMKLVLDGVSHLSVAMARVAALRPDLVKLAWSPSLAAADRVAAGAQDRLIRELGPERLVLHHAENEAALQWGLERGIRRFQGRHVDAMLGAARLSACAMSAPCALGQCVERAAAADRAGRRLCRNLALLDAGAEAGATAPVAA